MCYAFLALLGVALIFAGPKKEKHPYFLQQLNVTNLEFEDENSARTIESEGTPISLPTPDEKIHVDPSTKATLKEMLLSKPFILIYIMNSLSIFTGFFVVNQTKNYGTANNMKDHYLTKVASVGAIFNSCRFIWSWLLDHHSYKKVYGTLLVMQIFLNFTIFFVNQNRVFYAVWICLFMFCEGGHFVLAPNILKQIYGSKATQLYGILFSYTAVCSIAQIIL